MFDNLFFTLSGLKERNFQYSNGFMFIVTDMVMTSNRLEENQDC